MCLRSVREVLKPYGDYNKGTIMQWGVNYSHCCSAYAFFNWKKKINAQCPKRGVSAGMVNFQSHIRACRATSICLLKKKCSQTSLCFVNEPLGRFSRPHSQIIVKIKWYCWKCKSRSNKEDIFQMRYFSYYLIQNGNAIPIHFKFFRV